MRVLRHVIVTAAALFLMLGLPFLNSDYYKRLRDGTDAVSSASTALDKPSGEYVVFINRSLHTNSANLAAWEGFFAEGRDEGLYNVFEDLHCTVAENDAAGLEMANSFRSILPENQMKVSTENVMLMLSKAENGRFDVIVMSKEIADMFGAERIAVMTDADMLTVKQAEGEEA
ncbi:hypothetical protein [uncultured Ruminococcus sp.]|uniref:hypothetical protein n=1 Tax=uncultured Ruminococcus sp. TaxID=165186 RepID=UPI0025E0D874|nr:hypothetical protein [uncultured Ruminococcus sp.]